MNASSYRICCMAMRDRGCGGGWDLYQLLRFQAIGKNATTKKARWPCRHIIRCVCCKANPGAFPKRFIELFFYSAYPWGEFFSGDWCSTWPVSFLRPAVSRAIFRSGADGCRWRFRLQPRNLLTASEPWECNRKQYCVSGRAGAIFGDSASYPE